MVRLSSPTILMNGTRFNLANKFLRVRFNSLVMMAITVVIVIASTVSPLFAN
ncbi:MAG: hypothetical protein JSR44_14055 [Spirochaetes bacterium]|nr:hypothetical protein [Spirochaetota bacterium]